MKKLFQYGGLLWLWLLMLLGVYRAAAAVGVVPVGAGGLQNVTDVPAGANISNLFANARSGQTFVFDTGTNDLRGTLPTTVAEKQFVDVKLTNVHNIRLIGSGNTVFNVTNGGIGFAIQNCSNVHISGITFRADKTNGTTYQNGAFVRHGTVDGWGTNSWIVFENCRFELGNEFGLNAALDNGGVGYQGLWQDLQVLRTVFWRVGHTNYASGGNNPDGGAMEAHPNFVMDGCLIEECGRGIECFSSLNMSYNCIVRNTEFRNNWARGIFGDQSAFGTRWLIDGCHFTANPNARAVQAGHIVIESAHSATIINNTFTNLASGDWGVSCQAVFGFSRNVKVLNNTFSHVVNGIAFHGQLGGRIAGNLFEQVTSAAIDIVGDGAVVEENYFLNCGLDGSPVLWARVGGGTNCVYRNNWFVRKAGASPAAFIKVESATDIGTRIYGNQYQDVSGAVPTLIDAGSGTVRLTGTQQLTNSTTVAWTNLNGAGTLTNLGNVSVPAHALTNNNRQVVGYWSGTMQNAAASTNQFTIVFGSQTLLDTGLQIASNGTWRAGVSISRSSSGTAQLSDAWFEWNAAGVPFQRTNSVVPLAQTNGIATVLALQNGARRVGSVTNLFFASAINGIEP